MGEKVFVDFGFLRNVSLPENWNEGPYRGDIERNEVEDGDLLIAGRGCIYPGSQMDGWCYLHDGMYFKPLTPEAEEQLKAKDYARVHVTGENGRHLMGSMAATVRIGGNPYDLIFVNGWVSGRQVLAEDAREGYRLSVSHDGGHAAGNWYLTSSRHGGGARIGYGVTPPDDVKAIYAALPTKHRSLPPDCLCYVCGKDTGGKCYGCGRLICREHSDGVGDHMYDCWECSEKYCVDCWEKGEKARTRAEALREAADLAEEDWREKCRAERINQ